LGEPNKKLYSKTRTLYAASSDCHTPQEGGDNRDWSNSRIMIRRGKPKKLEE
jgi:hypothetical protein